MQNTWQLLDVCSRMLWCVCGCGDRLETLNSTTISAALSSSGTKCIKSETNWSGFHLWKCASGFVINHVKQMCFFDARMMSASVRLYAYVCDMKQQDGEPAKQRPQGKTRTVFVWRYFKQLLAVILALVANSWRKKYIIKPATLFPLSFNIFLIHLSPEVAERSVFPTWTN